MLGKRVTQTPSFVNRTVSRSGGCKQAISYRCPGIVTHSSGESTYPDKSPNSHANVAGQLYRVSHEVQQGDYVAYPSNTRRTVSIGIVTSDVRYDPAEPAYRSQRSVAWKAEVPRTRFSQGALHELGSAMSFFQVKTYAEEFLATLQHTPSASTVTSSQPSSTLADESVSLVAESIEENTRDFIIKVLSREVKGHPFSDFVASLLTGIGYRTRVSPPGADGGIDIIAHKDELGVEPPLLKIQVKSGEGSVGDPVVSALYGKVSGGEFGIVVTLGSFTQQAKLDLIRFGGQVNYVDLISSSFVEESLQAVGGVGVSIRRSLVAAGERPVAI
ncbi:MAG: restriction endonuclease [Acidimicrobiia bacterium]|nr:restriction endonuclease [Acidimicrobiia bacterium]